MTIRTGLKIRAARGALVGMGSPLHALSGGKHSRVGVGLDASSARGTPHTCVLGAVLTGVSRVTRRLTSHSIFG